MVKNFINENGHSIIDGNGDGNGNGDGDGYGYGDGDGPPLSMVS